ncbi:MAG TPA: hypothetical protein VFG43_04700 [Geminicoccaceae bacterium]|nr:hypothetical protein [Geminicoccaceae bacterium]
MSDRPNPLKLNPLQLKTLAILQELARAGDGASETLPDGNVALNRLPRPHGDHFHVGSAVVRAKDATGLGNPAVFGAFQRKGLMAMGADGRPVLTPAAMAYETGVAEQILHRPDH